jgi:hypothetical protein
MFIYAERGRKRNTTFLKETRFETSRQNLVRTGLGVKQYSLTLRKTTTLIRATNIFQKEFNFQFLKLL